MDFVQLAFFAFAAVAVGASIGVIGSRSPVHSALFLVLTFFSVACTWIIAGAEFLGVALVLVYVGAVMVLFLFVVMMIDVDLAPINEGFVRHLPIGLVVAVVMLLELLSLIGVLAFARTPFGVDPIEAEGVSNTVWLARRLFTDFLLPFEVAAVILTVAVVAAVTLTLRRREGTKHQVPGEQVRTRPGDRLRMVDMPVSRHVADEPPAADPRDGEGM